MATQNSFFFGNITVTSEATAVSVLALLQAASFEPTGMCVSLNIVFDTNTYWGTASTITEVAGALVTADTPVVDSADGARGNTIPISQMFVFKDGVGNASGVLYARFIA